MDFFGGNNSSCLWILILLLCSGRSGCGCGKDCHCGECGCGKDCHCGGFGGGFGEILPLLLLCSCGGFGQKC
ncbi:MAG: chorion class high-cysteine HCB protein 13 [Christensenellales bacterium]